MPAEMGFSVFSIMDDPMSGGWATVQNGNFGKKPFHIDSEELEVKPDVKDWQTFRYFKHFWTKLTSSWFCDIILSVFDNSYPFEEKYMCVCTKQQNGLKNYSAANSLIVKRCMILYVNVKHQQSELLKPCSWP